MSKLIGYLEETVLPIIDLQPEPKLGEWNWPDIAKYLREKITEAQIEETARTNRERLLCNLLRSCVEPLQLHYHHHLKHSTGGNEGPVRNLLQQIENVLIVCEKKS